MSSADPPPDDRLLSDLPPEVAPPAALEERVVGELRHRGLLGRARPRLGLWRLAASALLAFALGLWLGARIGDGGKRAPANDDERRYLLLLYEPRPIERAGLDLVAEYSAWAGELARAGRLVAAEKLNAEDRRFGVLDGPSAGPADGSRGEASISPTGFFLIRAASREEAERIAEGCPHLKHGGELSLRPVDPT